MRNTYQKEYRSFVRRNPEISDYLKRKRIKFALKLILVELCVLFVAVEIWHYGLPAPAVVIGIVAAVLIPLLFLRPFRTVGKGYCGEIVSTSHELRRVGRDKRLSGTPSGQELVTKPFVFCRVMTDEGKKRTFLVPQSCESVYCVGDRVLYIPGIALPISLKTGKYLVCPFCSSRMPSQNDHCIGCGASRIDV